jgi:uncharacterized protein
LAHLADRVKTAPKSPQATDLARLVAASPWFVTILAAVRDSGLPEAWVGAGVVRDLVWGQRYGSGFDPRAVRDVDVAFFDPADLTPGRDVAATDLLRRREPEIPWEATNQAAVHHWYPSVFGTGPVEPLRSIADAVATWPESATCVAVRLDATGTLGICAPYGLDDLLGGVWRRNPRRVTVERSRARLARQRPIERWPQVRVIAP